jgi:hypothetical protein
MKFPFTQKKMSVAELLFGQSTSSFRLLSFLCPGNLIFQPHQHRKALQTDTETLNMSWAEWQVNCGTADEAGMAKRVEMLSGGNTLSYHCVRQETAWSSTMYENITSELVQNEIGTVVVMLKFVKIEVFLRSVSLRFITKDEFLYVFSLPPSLNNVRIN